VPTLGVLQTVFKSKRDTAKHCRCCPSPSCFLCVNSAFRRAQTPDTGDKDAKIKGHELLSIYPQTFPHSPGIEHSIAFLARIGSRKMALINLRDIRVSFGNAPVLDGIQFQIEPGERV